MKVREALAAWRARTGQTESSYTAAWLPVALGRLKFSIPNPGQLPWHDLHHMLLGYWPDLIGEMEISAYELRTVPRTFFVLVLCIAGVIGGVFWAPRRTLAAWRRARGCRNLYGKKLPYDEILNWSVEELMSWMRIEAQDTAAGPILPCLH